MERETKTFQTPLNKELVLKTYLTNRESRKLRETFIKYSKVGYDERGNVRHETTDALASVNEGEDVLLELCVVSYDGSTEGIKERLLDVPKSEFKFILKMANEVASDEDEEEKKTEKAATR